MNISVREREETEGGNGGRWRQRWREIEAGDEEMGEGDGENDGAREMVGKGLRAQMESWGLPTLPHWVQREGRGQRPQDFF